MCNQRRTELSENELIDAESSCGLAGNLIELCFFFNFRAYFGIV